MYCWSLVQLSSRLASTCDMKASRSDLSAADLAEVDWADGTATAVMTAAKISRRVRTRALRGQGAGDLLDGAETTGVHKRERHSEAPTRAPGSRLRAPGFGLRASHEMFILAAAYKARGRLLASPG